MMLKEGRVAQYYIPNVPELGPIHMALRHLHRQPFSEIRLGERVLGVLYRFSMPHSVQQDLEKIFEQQIILEQWRYEPDGPIAATAAPAPIEGAYEAPPENTQG